MKLTGIGVIGLVLVLLGACAGADSEEQAPRGGTDSIDLDGWVAEGDTPPGQVSPLVADVSCSANQKTQASNHCHDNFSYDTPMGSFECKITSCSYNSDTHIISYKYDLVGPMM
jgi:hypothetical protein